jgi:hypothetical protein
MWRLLSYLLAAVVGGFLWLAIAVVSRNSASVDALLFWLPILSVVFPCSLAALNTGRVTTGIWLLAVAPLLGLAGAFLVTVVSGDDPVFAACIIWGLSFLSIVLAGSRKSRNAGTVDRA